MPARSPSLALPLVVSLACACGPAAEPAAEEVPAVPPLAVHQVCFPGPEVAETDSVNPFVHVRLAVELFGPGGLRRTVPGFFAADGDAANSSAAAGDQWCVRLREETPGDYTYTVRFGRGDSLALRPLSVAATEAFAADGREGGFRVTRGRPAAGFPHRLRYANGHYLMLGDSVWLKAGTNSPENLLSFRDFDGTYGYDTAKQYVKAYASHVADWRPGDATWGGNAAKGKGLIGALNYLASAHVNAVYFVTNNIGGDARDVWPYVDHETFDRFDVSKLEQWDAAMRHAQSRGIALQVVTQEAENETLLDGGDTGPLRQLYYRELVARFGHHPALVWNLGEENGPTPWNDDPHQTNPQRRAMAEWFAANDPYDHPVVIHTLPDASQKPGVLNPLLGLEALDGLSLQVSDPAVVHEEVVRWTSRSRAGGRPWACAMDEIGPWHTGSLDDRDDPAHDTLRREVLYGALMGGAYGVEWYYGWRGRQHDLNAEDFRARANLWEQTRHAVEWLGELPLREMEQADGDVASGRAWLLADAGATYAAYLPAGGEATLRLRDAPAGSTYALTWLNPRSGERIAESDPLRPTAGRLTLTAPDAEQDWAATLTRT